MPPSSTLGQHVGGLYVGEASADTDTGVVGNATRDGRTIAERNRAACGIALTRRRPETGREATGRGSRRETSTDVGVWSRWQANRPPPSRASQPPCR
jgi:hypothetical protein